MRILKDLQPSRVFYYFEDICQIPHGSGNTDKISDYCVKFAKAHDLVWYRDKFNNVIIKKNATCGYEAHPPVIIQGHLDMVCEKDETSDIDFLNDGLKLGIEGDAIYAKGTTLGGDDGIAIAMALAILESDSLQHPPIEAVFTTDEETGMDGAVGLDTSILAGKTLLNIDSENEGVLTVSCAGGARAELDIPLETEAISEKCYKVEVDGLIGGHSGVEIDKGRLNSNVVMGNFLNSLPINYNIVSIGGGLKDNAIPRSTECIISTDTDLNVSAEKFVSENRVDTDPDLKITITKADKYTKAFTRQSSKKIAKFLADVPNGIISMSDDIEGLVQTSLNLGILTSTDNSLHASFAVRSSVNKEKTALLDRLECYVKAHGGSFNSYAHYPAWEYKKDSPLRETMVKVYEKMYGSKPVVEAIHAGLECGLFCDKIADLDAVSFGPDMADIHTSREKLFISSTARTFDYLCNILKEL